MKVKPIYDEPRKVYRSKRFRVGFINTVSGRRIKVIAYWARDYNTKEFVTWLYKGQMKSHCELLGYQLVSKTGRVIFTPDPTKRITGEF